MFKDFLGLDPEPDPDNLTESGRIRIRNTGPN